MIAKFATQSLLSVINNLRQPILFAIAHTQSPNYASVFMYIKTPPTIRVGKNVGYIDA